MAGISYAAYAAAPQTITRTVKSKDGKHQWQVQVRKSTRGYFRGFFRDDSEGKWSQWRQVFPGELKYAWDTADDALKSLLRFVSQ